MPDVSGKVTTALAALWTTGAAEKMRNDGVLFALLNVPAGRIGCAFDGATDLITLSTAQTWPTRTRVRLESANPFGSPPSIAPLAQGVDYWLIRQSSTTFQIASSLSNAIAGTFLQLPTVAANSYNVVVQKPSETWPIAELMHWELNHPVYAQRFQIPFTLPNPTISGAIASQRFILANIDNTGTTAFTYNALAVVRGASSTPGDTTGTLLSANLMESGFNVAPVTIAQGEQREISYLVELQASV